MRLLHARADGGPGFSLTTKDEGNIPDYAILSHTWGGDNDEVIFEDIQNGRGTDKAGYTKLEFCAAQAARDSIDYFWVDTCCIKKTDSTELNESLIRMFSWYAGAQVCYVYMTDVDTRRRDLSVQDQFRQSRWFKRGWTLQELLAPQHVQFFSLDQEKIGDKQSLAEEIHAVTDVPITALSGLPLSQFDWRERMEWARRRSTKKEEDQAYCLMGIFEVNMIAMYGEGREEAFRRLKHKIHEKIGQELYSTDAPGPASRSTNQPAQVPGNIAVSTAGENRTKRQRKLRQRKLKQSLRFGVMDSRRTAIASPYRSSCEWFIEHPAYREWNEPSRLQEHHGLLWIGGKPGAGKSTLMKYLYTNALKSESPNDMIVSFFFNARGDSLERSTLGMWRALLFQLFEEAQDLLDDLKDIFLPTKDKPIVWTIDSLCQLFIMAVKELNGVNAAKQGLVKRRLKCFIDALDECDEDEVREMVHIFELLGADAVKSGHQLQICFASRHYPTITVRYCQRVVLQEQRGHIRDIADYVRSRLNMSESSMLKEEIRARIQAKANGVFMWVALVVRILNKEYARGKLPALKKKLEELPEELSDLFRELLTRRHEDLDDLVLSLQWILFATRPMTPKEFYYAMRASTSSETSEAADWAAWTVSVDDMHRRVINSSKGLAEVTDTDEPTVQFVHESVRDFLLKDNGLSELCPGLGNEVATRSHERLKLICMDVLELHGVVSARRRAERAVIDHPNTEQAISLSLKFLDYACSSVLLHANQAAKTIQQDQFLSDFCFQAWFEVFNRRESKVSWRTLEYYLAHNNCAWLIRTLFPDQVVVSEREGPYGYPLIAALANGHAEAARAILNLPETHFIGNVASNKRAEIRSDQTMLLWIIENGYFDVASLVLALLNPDVNETDECGWTALSLAVQRGCDNLVGELLSAGARVDVAQDSGLQPLHLASSHGFANIAGMLLAHGASVSAVDLEGRSALHLAAAAGADSIICMLLRCGLHCDLSNCPSKSDALFQLHRRQGAITDRADIEAQDFEGRTPLFASFESKRIETTSLLLQHGAQTETKDANGRTAFLAAAEAPPTVMLKLFLDLGADFTACDPQGRTALHIAAENCHDYAVELLLQVGAKLDAVDESGRTPLLSAVQGYDFVCRQSELQHRWGRSFLDQSGFKVLQMLVDGGADPTAVDRDGIGLNMYGIGRRFLGLESKYLSDYDEELDLELDISEVFPAPAPPRPNRPGNDAMSAIGGSSAGDSPAVSRGFSIDQLCN